VLSTKYLRVCLFSLGAYLLRNVVSYNGEILQANAYRPCAGHLLSFMSIRVGVTKKWHFSQKLPACRRSFAVL